MCYIPGRAMEEHLFNAVFPWEEERFNKRLCAGEFSQDFNDDWHTQLSLQ